MSMVRDPVERFISFFYFIKANRAFTPEAWTDNYMKLDLNECTPSGLPECQPRPGDITELQLTFFCGHDPKCRVVGNRWALQMAMENVENFIAIGIAEDIPTSLFVFEYYLPTFFENYKAVNLSSGTIKLNQRPGLYAPSISNTTRAILRSSMKEDIEFYDFIRQRLFRQAKSISAIKKTY
ncbi:hypothetical protein SK128_003059 [Halocaridina rubra]|uniref:Sulfotransferase n=1 Tax=Halocaridina rubra TaxID=373956 RepID=A0AAN9A470_HALRR